MLGHKLHLKSNNKANHTDSTQEKDNYRDSKYHLNKAKENKKESSYLSI